MRADVTFRPCRSAEVPPWENRHSRRARMALERIAARHLPVWRDVSVSFDEHGLAFEDDWPPVKITSRGRFTIAVGGEDLPGGPWLMVRRKDGSYTLGRPPPHFTVDTLGPDVDEWYLVDSVR